MKEIEDEENNIIKKDEINNKDTINSIKEEITKELKKNKSHDNRFKYLIVNLSRKYGKGGKKYAAEIAHYSLSSLYDC